MTFLSRSRWLALLMAIVLLQFPFSVLAQEAEMQEARAAAEADAQADTNGALWFAAGCIGGWIGLAGAYLIKPTPPASRLIGKSPEYTAIYTDTYQAKAMSIQKSRAWTGCITNAVVTVVFYVLAVAAASAE